jgi:hypothetical protein
VQLATEQIVEIPGNAPHAVRFDPSHDAWQVPVPEHAGRPARGAPATAMHDPTLPPTLHASHWPLHAVLQQTPSTQFPLPHSALPPHVAPSGFEHVPLPFALQTVPAGHEVTLQHALFVQNVPDVHCVPDVQYVPRPPFVTQVVPLQW